MLRTLILACAFSEAINESPDAISLLQAHAPVMHRDLDGFRSPEESTHWVFVTDCSAYMFNQGNQNLASAAAVKQPGNFTWIVYGCDRKEQFDAFEKLAHPGARAFHQKDADLIDPSTGKTYPAFQASNRPVAVVAWYRAVRPKEKAIAIIDPDMTWLRPVHLVQEPRDASEGGTVAWETLAPAPKRGTGALYGQGCQSNRWSKEQLSSVCGADAEKCIAASEDWTACTSNYSSGPPWILHANDAADVFDAWTDVAVKTHEVYPELLAEQVSWGVTEMKFGISAHLDAFWFVSAPGDAEQPWESIAALEHDPCMSKELPPAVKGTPPLFHACSTFSLHGDENSTFRLHKDHIHKDLLDCNAPLLLEPPADSLQRYKKDAKTHENTKEFQQTWAVCTYTNAVNIYATAWKKQFCTDANFEKSFAYPGHSMGFLNENTWLETVFRRGGWEDVDYKVGVDTRR